jgi:hypothetical protein
MTQLYATIRRSSKYYHQNEWAKRLGSFPFPVNIMSEPNDDYCVCSSFENYRLSDLNLYLIENGYLVKLAYVNRKRLNS